MFINKAIVAGDIMRTPRIKEMDNGGVILILDVQTREWGRDPWVEELGPASRHKIICTGRIASRWRNELCAGDKVMVEGDMSPNKWVDESGNTRRQINVRAFALRKLN